MGIRRAKPLKKILKIEVTSANKKTGALIKWNSKVIHASLSLALSIDAQGYGSLYYYGTHIGGNRAYKIVTLNPKSSSPALKLKAIPKTGILRLDGWSVMFYNATQFTKVVEGLRQAGFFKDTDSFYAGARS